MTTTAERGVITGFFIALLSSALVFSTSFHEGFYYPKLLLFLCAVTLGSFVLLLQQQWRLPNRRVLYFMAALVTVSILPGLMSDAPRESGLYLAFIIASCLLFIIFQNIDTRHYRFFYLLIIFVALIQIPIVVCQFFSWDGLLPEILVTRGNRVIGTIGNPEFLATWLGVSFFLVLHCWQKETIGKTHPVVWLILLLLVTALFMTKNKGGLLFIGLYFLYPRLPDKRWLFPMAFGALIAVIVLAPYSIMGRLFLWLVGLGQFIQHFLTGTGLRQFENGYLNTIHGLFSRYPWLSDTFGSYTAAVKDGHQLFIHWAAELGIGGLVLSILLAWFVWRQVQNQRNPLGAALLFLLFKFMYTVVLSSVTGMLLFVTLLAVLVPKVQVVNLRMISQRALPLLIATVIGAWGIYYSAADYYYSRGNRMLYLGQDQQAERYLQRSLEINPEQYNSYLALAHIRYRQQRFADMDRYIQQTLQYKRNKTTYKISAYMYFYSKIYGRAFDIYQFLHVVYPQHLTTMGKLASIYMVQQRYEDAHSMAKRVLGMKTRLQNDSDENNRRIARAILQLLHKNKLLEKRGDD